MRFTKAAFGKALLAPPDKRGALWAELKPELEVHEQIEDACLYERLSHDAREKDSKLTAWQQHQAGDLAYGAVLDALFAHDAWLVGGWIVLACRSLPAVGIARLGERSRMS